MPDLVTVDQLRAFAPTALALADTAKALSQHMARCEINIPRRIRHFMAHIYVESAGFTRLEENLNYSVARLQQVWPSRFPTPASAAPFARNPRALAGKVYGGRMGNAGPLDGWLYRGGGWLQLTGKSNYQRASTWTGLDLIAHPEWARTPAIAAQIACDFWRLSGLNAVVDKDADEGVFQTLQGAIRHNEEDDLVEGTRIINGGLTGLAGRRAALQLAGRIWK
jgi:putative chitinase